MIDPDDPITWPPDTLVLRGGVGSVYELARHRSIHDASGRLRLADLEMHRDTPFDDIADREERVLFIDGEDAVYGRLILEPGVGWLGEVDWSTQQVVEAWPPATVGAR